MIHAINVTNERDETIRLELSDPWKSGIAVQSITGLGPAKANVYFTELVTTDGAIDNSARLQTRNIILDLLYVYKYGNNLIEDSRLEAYRHFTIKRNIKIEFETDNRKCYAIGRVEKLESKIFDKNSGCQISILCPDPYFYADDQITYFYRVIPKFEFPFENNALHQKLIEMSELELKTERVILYDGEADTGVLIRARALGAATGIYFYNEATREIMRINDQKLSAIIPGGIRKGDEIVINTNRGKKKCSVIRDLVEYNILSAIEWPIQWIRLVKGGNLFMYNATSGALDLRVSVENQILYEGV